MIIDRPTGLIRLSWERQYWLETTSPLLTLECSSWVTLADLNLEREISGECLPGEELFPFVVQAYANEISAELPSLEQIEFKTLAAETFSRQPKAFRWTRTIELPGQPEPTVVLGFCLPNEVSETKSMYCLDGDEFLVFPEFEMPKDLDFIEIYGDLTSKNGESD